MERFKMGIESWQIEVAKEAQNDSIKLGRAGLKSKVEKLKAILEENPFQNPPAYKKLTGHANRYSRRIDIKHRLEYEVYKNERIVKILRMWAHYSDN